MIPTALVLRGEGMIPDSIDMLISLRRLRWVMIKVMTSVAACAATDLRNVPDRRAGVICESAALNK